MPDPPNELVTDQWPAKYDRLMATDADRAEMLTYANATQEQVAEVRAKMRSKLAERDAEWTEERWDQAREQLRQRFAA